MRNISTHLPPSPAFGEAVIILHSRPQCGGESHPLEQTPDRNFVHFCDIEECNFSDVVRSSEAPFFEPLSCALPVPYLPLSRRALLRQHDPTKPTLIPLTVPQRTNSCSDRSTVSWRGNLLLLPPSLPPSPRYLLSPMRRVPFPRSSVSSSSSAQNDDDGDEKIRSLTARAAPACEKNGSGNIFVAAADAMSTLPLGKKCSAAAAFSSFTQILETFPM